MVFWQAHPLTWQESIAPDSHRLPQTILPLTIYHFSDIPPSSRDIIFHYLLLMVPSHNSVSPFPPAHPSQVPSPLLILNQTPSTSPDRTRHSFFPAISRSKGPVGHLLQANLSVSLLICPPMPNGYLFAQN
jgi:hypothetical protein